MQSTEDSQLGKSKGGGEGGSSGHTVGQIVFVINNRAK